MIRRYLSEFVNVGTEAEKDLRTAVSRLVQAPSCVTIVDGRADPSLASGVAVVETDVTDAQHATLVADPRVTPLPIEDSDGAALPDTAVWGDIGANKRTRITERLEAIGVPIPSFPLDTPIRRVIARITKRLLLRQYLRGDDWTEPLDSTWGQLESAKRARIRTRLQELEFDTTPINGPDTLRVAIQKLLDQDVLSLRVPADDPTVTT